MTNDDPRDAEITAMRRVVDAAVAWHGAAERDWVRTANELRDAVVAWEERNG